MVANLTAIGMPARYFPSKMFAYILTANYQPPAKSLGYGRPKKVVGIGRAIC
jgi:hypothetical protein